jgi:hypothetical protein
MFECGQNQLVLAAGKIMIERAAGRAGRFEDLAKGRALQAFFGEQHRRALDHGLLGVRSQSPCLLTISLDYDDCHS